MDALGSTLSNIDTTKMLDDNKKSMKKQTKDKEQQAAIKSLISSNEIKDKNQMQKDSTKENEEAKKQQDEDRKDKTKQAQKDKALQDFDFS